METELIIAIASVVVMAVVGGLTVFAIIFGPQWGSRVATAKIAEYFRKERQLDIFRKLLNYRVDQTHPDFVHAFNLLDVEFPDSKEIQDLRKEFLRHVEEINHRNESPAIVTPSVVTAVKLISAVGREIGVDIRQMDFLQERYWPVGLDITDKRKVAIEQRLLTLLSGTSFLLVKDAGAGRIYGASAPQDNQPSQEDP